MRDSFYLWCSDTTTPPIFPQQRILETFPYQHTKVCLTPCSCCVPESTGRTNHCVLSLLPRMWAPFSVLPRQTNSLCTCANVYLGKFRQVELLHHGRGTFFILFYSNRYCQMAHPSDCTVTRPPALRGGWCVCHCTLTHTFMTYSGSLPL